MFKRMQKLNDRLEKDRKKGVSQEDQGPPEMALDDDSDSESSSSSSSSSGSSSSSSSSSGSSSDDKSKRNGNGKHNESNGKKDDGDESSSDESESESDSDNEESEDASAKNDSDDAPIASIEKAINDPIFIHPRAASKAGFKHRSCFICPVANLKTERTITTHIQGGVSTKGISMLYLFFLLAESAPRSLCFEPGNCAVSQSSLEALSRVLQDKVDG
jgi:hypothetical protein